MYQYIVLFCTYNEYQVYNKLITYFYNISTIDVNVRLLKGDTGDRYYT